MKRSPTIRLLLGLLVTLAAITGFSVHSLHQLNYLRKLQTETIDLNRHDSLLLLRVQLDVNTLGIKLQEMTESHSLTSITRYRVEFDRLRDDLNRAVQADVRLAPTTRKPGSQAELTTAVATFWAMWDEVYDQASHQHEKVARHLAGHELTDQQIVIARTLSHFLEGNNEAEARADITIAHIYDGAEHQTYVFLAAAIAAILFTSLYLIYSNRRIFDRLEVLSRQRRVLAARLISVQEEVLRSVSRELHDEFGQILTAVSAMLLRAERKGVPADSPLRTELSEVREITHNTLEKMRSLSQMLHPAILDDYGLAKGVEWYTEVFQRQTGIETTTYIDGEPVLITGSTATHCFRIVQEALTNAAKHAQTKSAEVLMSFEPDKLTIRIRDFGAGMPPPKKNRKPGLGLIAMRERAEILRGEFLIASTPNMGTTVSLVIRLTQDEVDASETEDMGEEVFR